MSQEPTFKLESVSTPWVGEFLCCAHCHHVIATLSNPSCALQGVLLSAGQSCELFPDHAASVRGHQCDPDSWTTEEILQSYG